MLTLRKKLFIENYKALKSGAEAAKIAGYSPKSAADAAHRLLRDADVSAALKAWEAEELEKPRLIREKISREVYEKTAWERSEELRSAKKFELAFKYFELYGKARGYVQSEDATKNDTPLIHLIAKELKLVLPGRETAEKETPTTISSVNNSGDKIVGLATLPSGDYRTLTTETEANTPTPPPDQAPIDTPSAGEQTAAQIGEHDEKNQGAGAPVGQPPSPGSFISVNPKAESLPIFEPIKESK